MSTPLRLTAVFAAVAALVSGQPAATFNKFCVACHSQGNGAGGINLKRLLAEPSLAPHYRDWFRVAEVLEEKRMPPAKLPQPSDAERQQAAAWIRAQLRAQASATAGDPGQVTVRRLTTAEYGYAIQDLTTLDLNLERDLTPDEVGGEGFTNFGDVQFVQDAGIERYLEAAKRVASHAVIGAGPLSFFADPGKTGFELSAIARIQAIYAANGFRTVSGEGGRPFGLERYGKALYVAWRYRHRAALGEPNVTLAQLAAREAIPPRFAQHIYTVLNAPTLRYPSAEAAARWRNLPVPAAGGDRDAVAARARQGCEQIQQFLVTWPSWLFARGDLAAGGAGDERPLEFSDASLKATPTHSFRFFRGLRGGEGKRARIPTGGAARVYLDAALVNPSPAVKPVIVWKNATIIFRPAGAPPPRRGNDSSGLPRHPLRSVLTPESLRELHFGRSLDGAPIGPDDFASAGPVSFEVRLPDGISVFELQIDASLGADRNQVFRVTISDKPNGATAGVPIWGLVGDPASPGYQSWKEGVLEYARLLPPNSHGEPTPADKDPIPAPFDNTYNVPEHDEFIVKVKYLRDDRFLVDHVLDAPTRRRLDEAWADLMTSFDYHDTWLALLAKKLKVDLHGRSIQQLDDATLATFPPEFQQYARPLRAEFLRATALRQQGIARHLNDCLAFAARAWRRPLTPAETARLQAFYRQQLRDSNSHDQAIRALLARILVSPAFLYRAEPTPMRAGIRPLTSWEMASRLSFFLWSSLPDDDLRRAALANQLLTPAQIERQVRRMLAHPNARRFATEFFGQWLGFYRFDEFRGVDPTRFPEFTAEVKSAMYEEAVTFFTHIVRHNRPLREIFHADYTFLNPVLARHYGIAPPAAPPAAPPGGMTELPGASAFHRGGVLRLGAVLTATSAPLRTSPVKRGDWLLRRILGTPTPPPPPDAGSIPADDKQFGGLSLRERLLAHQRNPSCAGCHSRIDPLGFPLERFDPVGRWRHQYADGKPIHDSATLAGQEVAGIDGLLRYLDSRQDLVLRNLSNKLLGYALGRTILLSDQPLIDRMTAASMNASLADLAVQVATSRQFRFRREDVSAAPSGQPVAFNSTPVSTPSQSE
jgi:hypothetical protein